MSYLISTSELQKNIGRVRDVAEHSYIVTNRGKGLAVMLPYFDGCDRLIEDYMEDYEMYKNKDKLQKRYRESLESGLSDLVI